MSLSDKKSKEIKSCVLDMCRYYYHASFGLYFYEMVHKNREFRDWVQKDEEGGRRFQIESTIAFCTASTSYLSPVYICNFTNMINRLKNQLHGCDFEGKDDILDFLGVFSESFSFSDGLRVYRDKVIAHPNSVEYYKMVKGDVPIQEAKDRLNEIRDFLEELINVHMKGIVIVHPSFPDKSMEKPNECVLDTMLKCIQKSFFPIVHARLKAESEGKRRNLPSAAG